MKRLWIIVAITVLLFGSVFFMKLSDSGSQLVWSVTKDGTLLLPLVAVSALIDSINPCAFSVLFLTIAFLISLGKGHNDILKIGGFYVLGIFAVYLGIGLGIMQVLHLFDTPHFMAKVGAILLIALGSINILGDLFPSFPIKFKIPSVAHGRIAQLMEKTSLPAAFGLGALVGLCEFPCTGGPYLMVLGLLHDSATYMKGLAYLVFYNLLFVLPLMLVLFLVKDVTGLERFKEWRKKSTRKAKFWASVASILIGAFILTM